MVAGICAEVGEPGRELVAHVQSVAARQVVEQVEQGATGGLGTGGELGEQKGAADSPSLSRTWPGSQQ